MLKQYSRPAKHAASLLIEKQAKHKEVRSNFGSTLIRYAKFVDTYDPIDGGQRLLSPANRFMLAHLEHWMREYRVDGIRMDSVENVYNWDFVGDFTRHGRELFRERWNSAGLIGNADARFLVVGEELSEPLELLGLRGAQRRRLDSLWHESFKRYIRSALIGRNADDEPSFEQPVRKAIDCRHFDYTDGTQAVIYLGSHDVGGFRNERLFNYFQNNGVVDAEKRTKLAFACLLTAVGVPQILAGDEFADQHDLLDEHGSVSDNTKQVDPVNYSRLDQDWRRRVKDYVAARAPCDVWQRGSVQDPVVVVANFSDFASERTPQGVAEYRIPNWPQNPPPAGKRWRDVSQDRDIPPDFVGRESLFAWEAKVYALVQKRAK